MDDHDLLEEYVAVHSERAFATLVERHLPFVYATALRLARDPHTAQDIAQAVFIQLARKADSIRNGHALPGWLYRATRHAAAVVFRGEGRRRQRETIAMNLAEQNAPADSGWTQIAPVLDEALSRLTPADQDAVLLRFFHEKTYQEIGVALGLKEDAARKRVERAIEDVRGYFTRRGVTTTAALLGTVISAHAATPPPVAFSAGLASASLTGAAAVGVGQFGWNLFLMTTQTKIIAAAFVVAAIAAVPIVLQQYKINELSEQLGQKSPASQSADISARPSTQSAATQNSPAKVATPSVRPAPASQSVNAPLSDVNVQSAVKNNLRQLSSAAQQYFLDKGVLQATYFDLVGTGGTDNYLRNIIPIGGEDYTGLVIHQSDTQISVRGADGSTVTFDQ